MPAPCGLALQAKSDPFPTAIEAILLPEKLTITVTWVQQMLNAYLMAVNQKAESGCGKRKSPARDRCLYRKSTRLVIMSSWQNGRAAIERVFRKIQQLFSGSSTQ
jgi:hypothetical protein